MEKEDTSNLFKDYKYPEKVKPQSVQSFQPVKSETAAASEQVSEEDKIKRKYQKAGQSLQEKNKKNMRQEKGFKLPSYERIGYIAVILVLVAYIGIDLGFYHGNPDTGIEAAATGAAVKLEEKVNTSTEANATNKTNEKIANESKELEKEEKAEEPQEKTVAEEKKLSGIVTLTIDKIYSQAVSNDTGYIIKVDFTINNGKDKTLKPLLDVYAFDSKLDEIWETKSRGQYKGNAIEPGSKQTGSIALVPKTFSNIKLEKTIRLALNDTKDGFITAVNEQVSIS